MRQDLIAEMRVELPEDPRQAADVLAAAAAAWAKMLNQISFEIEAAVTLTEVRPKRIRASRAKPHPQQPLAFDEPRDVINLESRL